MEVRSVLSLISPCFASGASGAVISRMTTTISYLFFFGLFSPSLPPSLPTPPIMNPPQILCCDARLGTCNSIIQKAWLGVAGAAQNVTGQVGYS